MEHNIKRMNALADRIEKNVDESFSMRAYWIIYPHKTANLCGTPGCLAGWTVSMFGSEDQKYGVGLMGPGTNVVAAELLGMDPDQAYDLFLPVTKRTPSRDEAVATLRRFIKTGEVHWPEWLIPDKPERVSS